MNISGHCNYRAGVTLWVRRDICYFISFISSALVAFFIKTIENLQEDSLLEKEEKLLEDSGKTQNDTNKPKKEEKIIVDTEKVQNNSNDASVNDAPRKQEGIKHMSFSAVGEVVTGC